MMDASASVKVIDILCGYFDVKKDDTDFYDGMTPFMILISTVLSLQTTEHNARIASEKLFSRYGNSKTLAHAEQSEVETLIHSSGYFHRKASAVIGISKAIEERFNGIVPDTMEGLLELPSVGRKTAACVLRYAYGIPSVIVDTHINRVSNRLGISYSMKAADTESSIREKVPPERWDDLDICFMSLGREICRARRAECERCPVSELCEHRADLS